MISSNPTLIQQKSKPFLKWAGGKVNIIHELVKYLPDDYKTRRYIEPFLGGGSMFFYLSPDKAIISDLNEKLINCYKQVRDNPKDVYSYLTDYQKNHSLDFYYKLREKYNKSSYSPKEAAQFIYLNKAGFNGIFRVNNKGEFNVPFNQKEVIGIPTLEHLNQASGLLKKAKLVFKDYKELLNIIEKNDFIYLDPPYPPLNGTAYFTHYTKERFNIEDQEALAEYAVKASKKGAKILISNASTAKIRSLYKEWDKNKLPVRRWITCKEKKHLVEELIIKNY
ncbi:MAG: Dam family site-specific DNA-(adenine-N6)-methyltransferase [Ignavibacterium sp.]|nr:Dam family site-specific DNA-(adenine-N6)-methyltransferase [Ignavibacterium sp.]